MLLFILIIGFYLPRHFYPTAFKGCAGILFSSMTTEFVAGWWQKVCPGSISETVRYRKLILGRDIGWGFRCAPSSCDLDLTFYLAAVTLTFKKLSGLYLRNF